MKRVGKVIKLKPNMRDKYIQMHSEPWPEVIEALSVCNISNFSIFLKDDYLFSYYEYIGHDYMKDIERLEQLTSQWLKETEECQVPVANAQAGEWWSEMDQVFLNV